MWGQLVHPSALLPLTPNHSLHDTLSLSSCTVFTVFTQPQPSPLGNDVGGSVQLLRGEERDCLCPQLTSMNSVGGLS